MGLQGSRSGEQAVGGGFGGREQTQTGPTRLLSGEIHALQTKNSEVQLGGAGTIKATVCTLPRGHGPRAQPGRWVLLRALETSHSAGTWRGRIRTRGRPSLEVVRYSLAASADGPASPGDRRECFRSSASLSPPAWLQPSWGGAGGTAMGMHPGGASLPFPCLGWGRVFLTPLLPSLPKHTKAVLNVEEMMPSPLVFATHPFPDTTCPHCGTTNSPPAGASKFYAAASSGGQHRYTGECGGGQVGVTVHHTQGLPGRALLRKPALGLGC